MFFGLFKSSGKKIEEKILLTKTEMHRAIVIDDDALAKICLTARFQDGKGRSYALNPNTAVADVPSFLHLCAQLNRPKIADTLIAGDADVHKCVEDGITPLHTAARYGTPLVAETLLKNGANINAQTQDGLTPLHRAVLHNQTTMAEFLLKNGANKDIRSNDGKTPAQYALEKNFLHFQSLLGEADRRTTGPTTAATEATPSGNDNTTWEKIDAKTVVRTRRVASGNLTLVEIFDFAARERKTLTRFDAGHALAETKNFDHLSEKAPLEEALTKLKELGGTPDPDSIRLSPRHKEKFPGRTP